MKETKSINRRFLFFTFHKRYVKGQGEILDGPYFPIFHL